jgi:acetylornithine deacetylase
MELGHVSFDSQRVSPATRTSSATRAASRINDRVEGLRDDIVAALRSVIRVPSVTPRYPGEDYDSLVGGEGEVARALGALYERAGCEVDLFGVEPGRENCIGVLRGAGMGRSLIYNGHSDVVPPGPTDEWGPGGPWSGRVSRGKVWGRGACDMKAGIVAQAFAAIALAESGIELAGDLILETVVGEEMMEHELGTTACIRRGYRADAAVVSEASAPPEQLAVAPVTCGVLWFEVAIEGKACHTSMRGESIHAGGYGTDVGVSAIDKAALILTAIRQLEDEWGLAKTHPLYRPGHFALAPGVFVGAPKSGLVPFAIPDRATIDYIVWYSPSEEVDDVRREIEEHITRAAQVDRWLRAHPPVVTWKHHWPKSVVASSHPIVGSALRAHEQASGTPGLERGFVAVNHAT